MSNQSRSSLSNPVPQFRWWTIALIAALALLTALFVTVCAQAKTLNYFADLKAGNGRELYASVVQGRDGNFYGAGTGGIYGGGGKFAPDGDLGNPGTPLTPCSDGNLYGTFSGSGSGTWGPFGKGAIYEVTPKGGFKILYAFCPSCNSSGFSPLDSVFQGTDGNFYGTTAFGGKGGWHGEADGFGTVFQFSNNLSPFVQTVPAAGKAGKSVIILGYGLNGTSSVTFNGIPAEFTVESDTCIRATVPVDATTGTVSVVTLSGTLNSNPKFVVTR